MRFLCRIGWHKWGKWSSVYYTGSKSYGGSTYWTERRAKKCSCCGWVKQKAIRDFLVFKDSSYSPPQQKQTPIWSN